jgi:hypothetical protein
MPLEIEFSDGRIGARAESGPASDIASAPSKPRARRAGTSGQGDLF